MNTTSETEIERRTINDQEVVIIKNTWSDGAVTYSAMAADEQVSGEDFDHIPTDEEIAEHLEDEDDDEGDMEAADEQATIEDTSSFVRGQEDDDGGTDDWVTGGSGDLALRGITKSRDAMESALLALKELASEAGDVPIWNEGGAAYEACEKLRAALGQ